MDYLLLPFFREFNHRKVKSSQVHSAISDNNWPFNQSCLTPDPVFLGIGWTDNRFPVLVMQASIHLTPLGMRYVIPFLIIYLKFWDFAYTNCSAQTSRNNLTSHLLAILMVQSCKHTLLYSEQQIALLPLRAIKLRQILLHHTRLYSVARV